MSKNEIPCPRGTGYANKNLNPSTILQENQSFFFFFFRLIILMGVMVNMKKF